MTALPASFADDRQGWTSVNPAHGEPYLNYCRDCGWAGSVALWFGDARGGPFCPRCRGDAVGRLVAKPA